MDSEKELVGEEVVSRGEEVRTTISFAKPSSILSKLDNFSNSFSMMDSNLECESRRVTISIVVGVRAFGVEGVDSESLFRFSKMFFDGFSWRASLKLVALLF